MPKKGQSGQRIEGVAQIALPLILSSLDRIETVSIATELRCFGQEKSRTWYAQQPFHLRDFLVMILALCLLGISFWLLHMSGGRFYNPFQ